MFTPTLSLSVALLRYYPFDELIQGRQCDMIHVIPRRWILKFYQALGELNDSTKTMDGQTELLPYLSRHQIPCKPILGRSKLYTCNTSKKDDTSNPLYHMIDRKLSKLPGECISEALSVTNP